MLLMTSIYFAYYFRFLLFFTRAAAELLPPVKLWLETYHFGIPFNRPL